jgi:L-ascorbate metabolism protein UlaG (beta-lactamase superfamily)
VKKTRKKRNIIKRALVGAGALAVLGVATGALLVGCLAAPAYEGPMTRHFNGKRFENRIEVPEKGFSDLVKWWWEREPPEWLDRRGEPAGPRPERRVDEPGRLVVTHVNHSTMLLQLDGVNLLTDPVYSERVGPISWAGPKRHRDPGVRFEDLPPIDVVLISHNHYDHLDLPTLKRLARRDQPRILVPLGNRALLEKHDIPGGEEVDWGRSKQVGPLRVTFLTSRHWSGRGMGDRFKTLWGAFVIEGRAGGPIYFAGDTGWGPHFAEAREKFGPMRLALLPIGAYEPRWFMKAAHISPAEAVEAHLVLGATTSVAMHYGTFQLSDEGQDTPPAALRRALKKRGVDRSGFAVLEHGRPLEVAPMPAEPQVPTSDTDCAKRPGPVAACVVSPR